MLNRLLIPGCKPASAAFAPPDLANSHGFGCSQPLTRCIGTAAVNAFDGSSSWHLRSPHETCERPEFIKLSISTRGRVDFEWNDWSVTVSAAWDKRINSAGHSNRSLQDCSAIDLSTVRTIRLVYVLSILAATNATRPTLWRYPRLV